MGIGSWFHRLAITPKYSRGQVVLHRASRERAVIVGHETWWNGGEPRVRYRVAVTLAEDKRVDEVELEGEEEEGRGNR